MLTYASVEDFKQMKDFNKSGIVADLDALGKAKIQGYLERATRFIDRFTRRQFFPWYETRQYPVPYAYYDLTIRRFPSAHLKLDADLLEVVSLNNGINDIASTDFYLLEQNIYPKSIVVLKFPNFWGGLTGASVRRYDQPIVILNAMWGYADYRYPSEFWLDTLEVLLTGGLDIDDTQFTLTDVNGLDIWGRTRFAVGNMIKIETELMEVLALDTVTNKITVSRGARGSTAAIHAAGTKIYRWRIVEDIQQATLQIAKTWREADLAVGGRIGVSDMSSGVELSIPADPLNTIKMYTRSILYG